MNDGEQESGVSAPEEEVAPAEEAAEASNPSDDLSQAAEIASNAKTTFFGIGLACAYSFLTIFTTTDAQLLANSSSSTLPVINAQVPIVLFYLVVPVALTFAYFYFHMYLQGMWRCLSRLPVRAGKGATVDEYVYPWMISSSLLRAHVVARLEGRRPLQGLEKVSSIFLAWWLVPITVFAFWVRYLMRHDAAVTTVHVVLLIGLTGGGIWFYRLAVGILRGRVSPKEPKRGTRKILYKFRAAVGAAVVGVALLFFSTGAFLGAPASHCGRAEHDHPEWFLSEDADASAASWSARQYSRDCDVLYAGGRLLEAAGMSPYASLLGVEVSRRPSEWSGSPEELERELKLVKGAKLGNLDVRHAQAEKAFLVAADLTDSDLRWSGLDEAHLQGANLTGALLQRSSLNGANLQGAVLEKASLQESRLNGANLRKADLSEARLGHSQLRGADLRGADLTEAQLQHCQLKEADFRNAVLEETDLTGAKLRKANFEGAMIEEIVLEDGDLYGANFKGAKGKEANFKRAYLAEAILEGATIEEADLREAMLLSARMEKVDLQKAKLHKANLTSAKLGKAYLVGADLREATLVNADLRKADLRVAKARKASLKGAWLQGAVLVEADLREAILEGALLKGANFSSARLDGTDLSGVDLSKATGLTQTQLDAACGDGETRLPTTPPNLRLEPCRGPEEG